MFYEIMLEKPIETYFSIAAVFSIFVFSCMSIGFLVNRCMTKTISLDSKTILMINSFEEFKKNRNTDKFVNAHKYTYICIGQFIDTDNAKIDNKDIICVFIELIDDSSWNRGFVYKKDIIEYLQKCHKDDNKREKNNKKRFNHFNYNTDIIKKIKYTKNCDLFIEEHLVNMFNEDIKPFSRYIRFYDKSIIN